MQCPKCGWQNPADATKCSNCFSELATAAPGQPQPTQQPPQQAPQQPYAQQGYGQQPYAPQPYGQESAGHFVPDYLVWSILVTIISIPCCACLPVSVAFGIVALVKSSAANSKKALGDYIGAQRDANAAKTWLYWAVGLDVVGLIGWIIYLIGVIMYGAGHGANN